MVDDVDWESLHARIARARVQTRALLEPDAAAERRILDERARRLARPKDAPSTQERLELALFSVGAEEYAIETQYVSRVVALPPVEPIPSVALPFLGVINYLGQPLPLIDIRALLASAPQARGSDDPPLAFLLVLGSGRDELGVAIAAGEQVSLLPLAEIQSERLPDGLRAVSFVRGLYQGRRLVLSGGALLEDPRLTLGEAS
jgi:chemotaxis signal transduction protein